LSSRAPTFQGVEGQLQQHHSARHLLGLDLPHTSLSINMLTAPEKQQAEVDAAYGAQYLYDGFRQLKALARSPFPVY